MAGSGQVVANLQQVRINAPAQDGRLLITSTMRARHQLCGDQTGLNEFRNGL
jgi:hypothetical protein